MFPGMGHVKTQGRIIGTAGGSLVGAGSTWAASETVAETGRRGEIKTGELLAPTVFTHGWTILHDLKIPIPGIIANIDHVVVAGNQVVPIDTKVWKPGFYWTAFGNTFRSGLSRFKYADTKTFKMAYESLPRFLRQHGCSSFVRIPLVAVWSSSESRKPNLTFLRVDTARAIPAERLERRLRRLLPNQAADPQIVAALSNLVAANQKGSVVPRQRTSSGLDDDPFRQRYAATPATSLHDGWDL